MKLAILGGSFNPIHMGHLFLAEEVLSSLGYDRVVLIPAYRSPFKLVARGMESSSGDRLEMIASSISGDPRLTLDDCEIRREGVSYTIDTLTDIIRRYAPSGKPALVIGDDLAADFPQWHNSQKILELADLIIARRIHSGELSCPFPHIQIPNRIVEISSDTVRRHIAEGKAWRYLVPEAARIIIEERGLYGCGTSGNTDTPDAPRESYRKLIFTIEQAARQELDMDRFIHSRNTALLCWDLCRRFGIDPDLGYLAGIAHDLCKPLGNAAILELARSDGLPVSKLEKQKPNLLHGRAAAVLLPRRFAVHNREVLKAIAMHTEGGEGMSALAKILYIADKVEVSREKADPALRAMCYEDTDLDRVFLAVLRNVVSWLQLRKIALSETTARLLEKKEKTFEKNKS